MLLVAHSGGVASLLSLVTVLGAGSAVVFVLAAVGRLALEEPGDLVLPLASVAVIASAAPTVGGALSDVAAPAAAGGAVLLGAVVAAALTGLDLTDRRVAAAAALVAVVAALTVGPWLANGPWRDRVDGTEPGGAPGALPAGTGGTLHPVGGYAPAA